MVGNGSRPSSAPTSSHSRGEDTPRSSAAAPLRVASQGMTEPRNEPALPKTEHAAWRVVRILLVGVLLLVVAVSAWRGELESCSVEETQGPSAVIVETCEPVAVTDPRYVVLLLIAALVLSPEIAEVSIGSISLKRRVQQNEETQKELIRSVGALEQQVAVQAHQTTVVSVPTYVSTHAPEVQAEVSGIADARRFETSDELTSDEVKVRLLELAERLSILDTRRVAVRDTPAPSVPHRAAGRELHHGDQWMAEVARWWPDASGLLASVVSEQAHVFTRNFPEALDSIRAVRNAIAHAKYVEPEDLTKTYSTALALEFFLNEQFRRFKEVDDGSIDGRRI